MRYLLLFLLLLGLGALSFQLYRLYIQRSALEKELITLKASTKPLIKENEKLLTELKYYENPDNLERELRKSGYAAPDEKVFVIVPRQQP